MDNSLNRSRSDQGENDGPEQSLPSRPVGPNRAARLLRVSPTTVQRWIDSGRIPAHRTIGGHRRMMVEDLADFARARGFPLPQESVATRPRILIVDDEEDVLRTLAIRIQGVRPDVQLLTAMSGFEAGLALSRAIPDLIILDIRMPGMDGIEVCRMIRRDARLSDVHIVGMTAYNDPLKIHALRAAGAAEIFLKPFDTRAIEDCLNRLLPSREGGFEPQGSH